MASERSSSPSKKCSARSGDTRRPLERIFAIHDAIQRGRFPNCRQLAEKIEVTQKTIQRDITFMQNDLGLPLQYDRKKHGYFYERPVHEFPLMRYSVEDVVALFLARKAVEPLQGTALEATLRDSFKRLSAALQGEVSFRWSDLDEAFSVKDSGIVPADVRLFEKVSRSVLECRTLRFEYRKIDAKEWKPRSVRPFHLADFDGGWYLIGYGEDRKAKRTFALQRMKGVRVMKSHFLRPTDFDLSDHLGGSFGVWHQPDDKGKAHRIRLQFTGWAARMVSERRWHPSQEIKWRSKKQEVLEVSLELSGFEEISRWILSWGPQVEVLEPEEFQSRETRAKDPVTGMREYGTHNQPAGTWSDDTSMILATMVGFLEADRYAPEAAMKEFAAWLGEGKRTPHGTVFDIGNATREAIGRFCTGTPATACGGTSEWSNGNGSLMRILPVALAFADDPALMEKASEMSALTHAHERSRIACAFFCLVVSELLHGSSIRAATAFAWEAMDSRWKISPEERSYFDRWHPDQLYQRGESEIHGTGHVIDTLEAALWLNERHDSYSEVVLGAVNLGDDTDTTGCVAGALAGLIYGEAGIPKEWREVLVKKEDLKELAQNFTGFCLRRPPQINF